MTVQWSRELLERHIAPGIYDFDRADIPDLSPDLMASEGWIFDHFINSVFRAQYKEPAREHAINFIYRAQTTIRTYQDAKVRTTFYLSQSKLGSPIIKLYFAALSTWEMCFLNWQMLVEVYNKLSPEPAFIKKDGSVDQRAYAVANSIKHSGGAGSGDVILTVPMWLTNDGFQTSENRISYGELAQLVTQAGEFAQQIIDPKSVARGVADSSQAA